MTAKPMESRIAHLEGVIDQIGDRLNGIDRRLDGLQSEVGNLRSELNARFGQMDQKFMWVIGINVTSWTTTMLAVLFHR